VITESIRLSDAEAREVAADRGLVGGTEAALLEEATLRGLREIRRSRAVAADTAGASSSGAARIAGLPRAPFLQALMDRGVALLRGPSAVETEMDALVAAEDAAIASDPADEDRR